MNPKETVPQSLCSDLRSSVSESILIKPIKKTSKIKYVILTKQLEKTSSTANKNSTEIIDRNFKNEITFTNFFVIYWI